MGWFFRLCSIPIILLAVTGRAEETTQVAWQQVAQMLLSDAHTTFFEVTRKGPASSKREAELGEAVVLLEIPPHTEGQIKRSIAILRRLSGENGGDDTGIAARYLLGRIQQVRDRAQNQGGDPLEFIDLIHEHPESFFAQLAMLKLTLHRLYQTTSKPNVADRLATAAEFEDQISYPGLLREYHLTLANAHIFLEHMPSEALRHLQVALDLGITNLPTRADVLVQIGELARELGQREIASDSYHRFLAENHLDGRVMMVRDRLKLLEGSQP